MITTRRLTFLTLLCGVTMALVHPGCTPSSEARPAEGKPTSAATPANPPELGKVTWRRDYDAALAESRRTGRPILLLFDEVPGCSTVNAFGQEVLSERQVVTAADSLFIAVVVYNNEGRDKRLLERWGEPAWNNPIIRFIDGNERELASRLTHAAGVKGVLLGMAFALRTARQPVPPWLESGAR